MRTVATLAAVAAALLVPWLPARAADPKLPATIAWTAYDVGSAGYNHAVAIGSALKNHMGVTLRVLPGKNDVSRLVPLREGKVQFSATGIGILHAVEAADVFGHTDWGPQPARLLATSKSDGCVHMMVAADAGIRTMYDLKGKRIAWVKGAPAANQNALSFLRFGNLTWDDVKIVEFPSVSASVDALIEGQVDGTVPISTSAWATRIMAGPRGGFYPPMPFDDAAAWKRMQDTSPYWTKHMCSEGAGIDKPFMAAAYPYPVLVAYAQTKDDEAYAMTKAMFDMFPYYKGSSPGIDGWALDRQVLEWVVPFHPGSVRYFKEVGKWTPAAEAHNEALLNRQKVLADAWAAYRAKAPSDADAFAKGWMPVRAAALRKAGMNPIWDTW